MPDPFCASSNPPALQMKQLKMKELKDLIKVTQVATRGLDRMHVQIGPIPEPSLPCCRDDTESTWYCSDCGG